jgi:predicted component of type VI protein secretion system
MTDNVRHETICSTPKVSPAPPASDYEGRLLQIHPVDLGSNLITIGEKPFVVGREDTCDLTVPEKAVSRRHTEIVKTPAGYVLNDLGSTNGTWVNESKTDTCLLKSGDRIRIGGRIFKFISTDQVEAQYLEAVYSMMTKDSLTGAWNKRYFKDMLSREMKRRARTRRPLSLLKSTMAMGTWLAMKSWPKCHGEF